MLAWCQPSTLHERPYESISEWCEVAPRCTQLAKYLGQPGGTLGRSPLNGRHQLGEPDKIEHPPEVVGKRGQAELSSNLLQTSHQKCTLIHPLFDRAERVLDRLAAPVKNVWTLRQPSRHSVQHRLVLQS